MLSSYIHKRLEIVKPLLNSKKGVIKELSKNKDRENKASALEATEPSERK